MSNDKARKDRVFIFIFTVMTILCWCPIGYGGYGQVNLIFGMPNWAATALLLGAVLFVLQWFYLFGTKLALRDEELPRIFAALSRETD